MAPKKSTPSQPGSNEQSGSAGRRTDTAGRGLGKSSGQDRYGQSGLGGKGRETAGQAKYRKSEADGDPGSRRKSNRGSGRAKPRES